MRLIAHRLALALVSATVIAGTGSSTAAAQQPPGVDEFIAIVQGHDAATIRRTFPAYNTGLFERLFGSGAPIPLTTPADRALFEQQLVRTPAGVILDVGHVIAGLEASLPLPPAARAVQAATGCSIRAAVTWSGDAGRALFDHLTGAATDPDASFAASASPEDLHGDIDGYLLGADVRGPDLDVAALLTRAYLSGNAFEPPAFASSPPSSAPTHAPLPPPRSPASPAPSPNSPAPASPRPNSPPPRPCSSIASCSSSSPASRQKPPPPAHERSPHAGCDKTPSTHEHAFAMITAWT